MKLVGKAQELTVWFTVMAGVMFCSAFVKELHHEHYIDFYPFDTRRFIRNTEEGVLAVAGLLVGFGTSLAGGCTFGHGVSGLARRQKASFLAVIIFCSVAYLTNRYKLAERIPNELTESIKLDLPSNIK